MYLRWFVSFLVSFAINLMMWGGADLFALIPATWKLERMPGWLWYLQTHDDNVYGSRFTNEPMPSTWWKRWRTAARWLRRNPGYAFDAFILGLPLSPVTWISDYRYLVGDKGFGYKRDIPLAGRAYFKVWIGWHNEPRGDSKRHMLKIAFGPKFDGKASA